MMGGCTQQTLSEALREIVSQIPLVHAGIVADSIGDKGKEWDLRTETAAHPRNLTAAMSVE